MESAVGETRLGSFARCLAKARDVLAKALVDVYGLRPI
jgi:hypothetical protein